MHTDGTVRLGIDQSLSCTGLFVDRGDGTGHHEIMVTKPNKADEMDTYLRVETITTRIMEVMEEHAVEVVNIEGLGFAATGNATRDLAGLQFVIITTIRNAYAGGVEINIIAPNTLKKFATGHGKASKDDMFDALPDAYKTAFGAYPKSKGRFDLADAFFLAMM